MIRHSVFALRTDNGNYRLRRKNPCEWKRKVPFLLFIHLFLWSLKAVLWHAAREAAGSSPTCIFIVQTALSLAIYFMKISFHKNYLLLSNLIRVGMFLLLLIDCSGKIYHYYSWMVFSTFIYLFFCLMVWLILFKGWKSIAKKKNLGLLCSY